jgi:hypothetical protein
MGLTYVLRFAFWFVASTLAAWPWVALWLVVYALVSPDAPHNRPDARKSPTPQSRPPPFLGRL